MYACLENIKYVVLHMQTKTNSNYKKKYQTFLSVLMNFCTLIINLGILLTAK